MYNNYTKSHTRIYMYVHYMYVYILHTLYVYIIHVHVYTVHAYMYVICNPHVLCVCLVAKKEAYMYMYFLMLCVVGKEMVYICT